MIQIHNKYFKTLISEAKIIDRIAVLAAEINLAYSYKKPLFIGILNGSFTFAAELFKNITLDAEITFMRVQSYQNMASQGKVTELLGLVENIENRDLIIIEDIVDTGLTINEILKYLSEKKPNSIKIATLLFKPKALKIDINPDYVGFEIEPKFVVGYGLDYEGLGRNLREIYVLKD
jgi:hypoxanthine phosphoribosyltransferase